LLEFTEPKNCMKAMHNNSTSAFYELKAAKLEGQLRVSICGCEVVVVGL